jgi:hypothetical protein
MSIGLTSALPIRLPPDAGGRAGGTVETLGCAAAAAGISGVAAGGVVGAGAGVAAGFLRKKLNIESVSRMQAIL